MIDHHRTDRKSDEMCEIRSNLISCATVCNSLLSEVGFDVNGDDRSDYYDIRAVMDHVIGGEDPIYNILNADFNGDNRITMYDLNQLLISFVKSTAE